MTSLVLLLLIVLFAVVVASEPVIDRPKGFSRRTFMPPTEAKFRTSSGLAGWDHQAVQEVAAKTPKAPGKSFAGVSRYVVFE